MILFRFARFGRFGCFGGFVSVDSAVSLVSFRWFRFVVSGFSTCQQKTPFRNFSFQGIIIPTVNRIAYRWLYTLQAFFSESLNLKIAQCTLQKRIVTTRDERKKER